MIDLGDKMKIGDKVKDSPVGPGVITGFTKIGYPQVNYWADIEDGNVFGNKPPGEIVVNPRLLIRLHQDGTLDEVVTRDESGECNFHLEQMDDFQWWMRWYGTKANPLPRELIVNIGPAGALQSFEPPNTFEDEKYTSPEYRTPPENISHEVDRFIRYFGVERLLKEIIDQTGRVKRDDQSNWPERDTTYLDKLAEDLTTAMKNYSTNYPGEPDYQKGDAPYLGSDEDENSVTPQVAGD